MTDYDTYVEHPKFGRYPRITGLDPKEDPDRLVNFWIDPPESKIPNTAIIADTSRQNVTAFSTPYYFDQKRICEDCHRPFIWFAEEQKFWFEELGFYLGTNCLRCVHCRQRRKGRPAKATDDSKLSEKLKG